MQLNNERHSWWTPIDKLTFWKTSGWTKYVVKSTNVTALRIYYDQLLITHDDKVLETFNMNNKIKGIYKGDVLILIASGDGQEIRKIKFQIKNNSMHWFEKLRKHFPISPHKGNNHKNDLIYQNIEEIFRKALEENGSNNSNMKLPPNYTEFVKINLLDPTFPFLVEETLKVIHSFRTSDRK